MPTYYGEKIKISYHAKGRMVTRNIKIDDVKKALLYVKRKIPLSKDGKKDSFRIIGENGLELVLDKHCIVIITMHWYRPEYINSRKKEMKNKKRKQNIKQYGNRARR